MSLDKVLSHNATSWSHVPLPLLLNNFFFLDNFRDDCFNYLKKSAKYLVPSSSNIEWVCSVYNH